MGIVAATAVVAWLSVHRRAGSPSERLQTAPSASAPPSATLPAGLLLVLEQMRRAFPVPPRLETLQALWRSDFARATMRELGFGLERRKIEFGTDGREGWACAASVVSRNGDIIEVLDKCDWTPHEFEVQRSSLEGALGPEFQWVMGPFAQKKSNWGRAIALQRVPLAYEAALAVAAIDLGAANRPSVPDALAESYAVLTSPSYELALGRICRFGTQEGYWEMLDLETSGRVDLLRSVLRGLNPEGRYFAAFALHELKGTDKADDLTIARLPRLPPESVTVCGGDVYGTERPGADLQKWLRMHLAQ
jgi:hypothetical protein